MAFKGTLTWHFYPQQLFSDRHDRWVRWASSKRLLLSLGCHWKRVKVHEFSCLQEYDPGYCTQLPTHNSAQETKAVFEKLHKFIGKNLKNLVERSDEDHVFRLHKNRIYYIRESLLKRATNVRPIPFAAFFCLYRCKCTSHIRPSNLLANVVKMVHFVIYVASNSRWFVQLHNAQLIGNSFCCNMHSAGYVPMSWDLGIMQCADTSQNAFCCIQELRSLYEQ